MNYFPLLPMYVIKNGMSREDALKCVTKQTIAKIRILESVIGVCNERSPINKLHQFLAVRESVFVEVFQERIGEILIRKGEIRLIVFDKEKEEIQRWVP